jgi:hypothetical protein
MDVIASDSSAVLGEATLQSMTPDSSPPPDTVGSESTSLDGDGPISTPTVPIAEYDATNSLAGTGEVTPDTNDQEEQAVDAPSFTLAVDELDLTPTTPSSDQESTDLLAGTDEASPDDNYWDEDQPAEEPPLPTATPSSTDDTLAAEALFEAAEAEYATVQPEEHETNPTLQGVADAEVFYWSQDNASPTQMIRSSEGICLLRSVQGRFRGHGEKITITNRAGYWWLEGESHQTGVAATATCVPFSAIKRSHPITYSTRPAYVWFRGGSCPPLVACGLPTMNEVVLGPTTSFCYLTGMGGHFRGGLEWIRIKERNGLQYLQVNTDIERGYIRAEAGCISLAEDRSQRVTGPTTWLGGTRAVELIPPDVAFCGFSQIQGAYQNARDLAYVRGNRSRQFVGGYKYTTSKYNNSVTARCYLFDQRTFPLPVTPSPVTPQPNPDPQGFRLYLPLVFW